MKVHSTYDHNNNNNNTIKYGIDLLKHKINRYGNSKEVGHINTSRQCQINIAPKKVKICVEFLVLN